ncbi:PQQ-dependent sugar dehydrogenase [Isoptericola sp. 4D.3]|uniref:PQQ-dependent sugar dehydrogenase n=1 Tax=Isoptericola peretonis TaxID=2918523 RepID=A0ABT0J219_9MICO|nr:PQQ-dependent sugar dehydrogenase [Isoptericola sp. 4D.3]
MDLAVLPDNDVLHVTRAGDVWLNESDTGVNRRIAQLDVYQHDEEGLQSIAVDPGYDGKKNRWIYMYYSPPLDTPVDDPTTPDVNEGDAPFTGEPEDFEPFEGLIRLSRFEYHRGEIDLGSEEQIIDVPVDRGICCHVGGDIVFDSEGNLVLSTGDDTNPFFSDGYAPLDDSPGTNPAFDARRTSGNTNDLRGKLLRITPRPGGGYTVPDGNLFEPGTPDTRPEIYAMGLRNPFRIEVDPDTDAIYVGDYSPDAAEPDPDRGPAGHGRWAVVREPGNFGWPFCATPELPYVDYDFATGESGEEFDCAAPVNDSAHNTGLAELPPVVQPDVWYSYGVSPEFPELSAGEGDGIGPMAGPAYRFDPADLRGPRPVAWPRYYDGLPLFYEWTRDYVKAMHLDDAGGLAGIEPVLPSVVFDNPMDMEFGPDGALYVLEYGDGYFAENPDAQLARIDHVGSGGNRSPVPVVGTDVTSGLPPLTVTFSSEGTTDPDGDALRYAWDFDGDGDVDARGPDATHTYDEPGVYRATLTVTDVGGRDRGRHASADVDVVVGNETPQVSFVTPVDGQGFAFGDTVTYEVEISDDQPVDCAAVEVTYIVGHDDHGHPQTTASGCTGSIATTVPSGHDPENDTLRGVFVAEYTDPGTDGLPGLTGTDEVVLVPAG